MIDKMDHLLAWSFADVLRAGVEEVRDRMKLGPPFQALADPVYANLPAVTPGGGANGVQYVIKFARLLGRDWEEQL